MTRSPATTRTATTRCRRTFHPRPEGLEARRLLAVGTLDPTFGSGGYVLASSGGKNPYDVGKAVEVQPDGKLIVAGSYGGGTPSFEAVRLSTNGALDPTFGSGGRALPFSGGGSYDLALQQDGSVVLAGYAAVATGTGRNATTQNDIAIVRLLPSGTMDAGFGQGGKVLTGVSNSSDSIANRSDAALAVAIQADGKIVVGGYTYNGSASGYDSILIRYNANGSLDTSFGQGGKVVTAWSAGHDNIVGLAVQGDGKIVVAGAYAGTNSSYYVARYNADGSLDDGFGTSGFVATPFKGQSSGLAVDGRSLALQPDGAIVFARAHFNGTDSDLALARYTTTGAPDTSFGGGTGAVTLNLGGNEYGRSVVVQPDGKLVVAGLTSQDSLVTRFMPDGTADATFGNGGTVVHSFSSGGSETLVDIALQSDGKAVAVGSASIPVGKTTTPAFLVARFLGDPTPLLATAAAPSPVHQTLTAAQARPALAQALAYWRARGADTSHLGHIDLAIADLGGARLGEASGTTITLDDNAAGWGWDVARVRRASGRMDLRAALIHEVGHLLGHGHAEGGVMAATLAPRTGVIRGR